MSAPQGCNDDRAVVEHFKEALKQRIGADRFRMWFSRGVKLSVEADADGRRVGVEQALAGDALSSRNAPASVMRVEVSGQFALDRLQNNFARELRGAAAQVGGGSLGVRIVLAQGEADGAKSTTDSQAASDTLPQNDERGSGKANSNGNAPASARKPASARRPVSAQGNPPAIDGSPLPLKQNSSGAAPVSDLLGASLQRDGKRRPKKRGTAQGSNKQTNIGKSGALRKEANHDAAEPQQATNSGYRSEQTRNDHATATNGRGSGGSDEPANGLGKAPKMTLENFIAGPCNQLARTAAVMACQDPAAATPLFLVGPSGTGKTHLMTAIADRFRRQQRMRRVIHLSAEQFTNDFIKSVGSSGLPSFRRRFRDVDALLIEDVQFLAAKKATLREMLYTVETLASAGRPLVFSANQTPTEIPGLTKELGGRMAAGLVCPVQPLDAATRRELLVRWVEQRCLLPWPSEVIEEICGVLGGDGRMVSGLVNLVAMLQRMYRRMPTMDEIRQFGGEVLRSQTPVATLSTIERAVCETFDLDDRSLQTAVQTRSITEPRMLAMYLSRQLTSSAYAEIARHYGGRSHSTAIAASRKVESWLSSGKSIGRGRASMSAQQAIERIETILRAG